ncbi:Lrp/AsnC family transcriptional regulator [Paenibacillus sp. 2TAB23]|uniref:Lrp/AsnC family transcriptional regulator n=1 Tax=Paenibacillus sp. 2TAB23 TaxID=3233004 RepID=UPI003F9A891C
MDSHIDEIDKKIMQLLRDQGRISISQISKQIAMSQPSVKERILKLEDKNIITGYSATFNLRHLDRGTTSFIMVKTEHCQELVDFCTAAKEVTDLHRISGEFNYLIQVQTSSVEEIAAFQDSLVRLGPSKTLISMKNMMENRILL